MEMIQGYGNSDNILNIKDKILVLYNNIYPDNKRSTFEDCCGENPKNSFWIILTWHNLPIAQTTLKRTVFNGKDYWLMYNFGVRKFRRREGWGTQLFQHVKAYVKSEPLIWLVDNDNINAQIFYRKNGGKDFGPIKDNCLMFAYKA